MSKTFCTEHLKYIIDLKFSELPPSPLGSDFILFYPEENRTELSESELRRLMAVLEEHLKSIDVDCFQNLLNRHMDAKGLGAHEVYEAALIDKSYFYQVKKGKRPSRDTAIRICLALKLDLIESEEMLQTLGYIFYKKNRRDIIVMECINFKTGLYLAESLLGDYGEVSLCGKSFLAELKTR